MRHTKTFILFAFAAFMLFACSKEEPTPEPQQTAVPQIILDTDIASSTDDLFAMQLLYRYAAQGRCNLLGVVVDRMGDTNAAVADLMNNYYGFPTLPIALERNGTYERFSYINYTPIAQATDDNGNLLFARTYSDYSTLPDGYVLYRRLLANAPDGSVTIMLTGIASTIANLLTSTADQYSPLSGVELVRRKVKRLYFMATKLEPGSEQDVSPGYNMMMHPEATSTLLQLWPADVDVIISPSAPGNMVDYTPEQVISDISWTDIHPIKQIYLRFDCNTGQRMWDPMIPLQEIEGESLVALSPRGHLSFNTNKVSFTADPDGNYRYQIAGDEVWAQRMLNLIRASNR
ncbi:MAG: nucleoside hydrolase [Bacteroidales bacterium]|nr:nucleoside hydrolase [Bacteroidales bacterium]